MRKIVAAGLTPSNCLLSQFMAQVCVFSPSPSLKQFGMSPLVTGRIEGRRARGHQRLKYLDSLCAS